MAPTGEEGKGVTSDSHFGTPGSVYYGMAKMSERKIFPAIPSLVNIHHDMFNPIDLTNMKVQYPDQYLNGGIQNGTHVNKQQPFVRNEMPLVRKDAPRLNLKAALFEERYKEIPFEYHVTPLTQKFSGFPLTYKDPKPPKELAIPATRSSYIQNNYPGMASLNSDSKMLSQVQPYHNPNMTSQNSFQPFSKPYADKVVNPNYAQEKEKPRLNSNWQFGHEVESCCRCNNPFQKFSYHRMRGNGFDIPDGSFKNHPSFHCDNNAACLCHEKHQPQYKQQQSSDPFVAVEYSKMYTRSIDQNDNNRNNIIKSRSQTRLGPQFNFTLDQLNHMSLRGGPDRETMNTMSTMESTASQVPYHTNVDYGSRAFASRVIPNSSRKNTLNKTPFSSQFSEYMNYSNSNHFHQNLITGQPIGNQSNRSNCGCEHPMTKSSSQINIPPILGYNNRYKQVNSIGNEEFYKVEKNSVVVSLFGELVIRYDLKSMTLEKFALLSITQVLSAYDSSFVQLDQNRIFICGGLRRGTSKFLSDFAAIFDCSQNEMIMFTPMQVPRHKHACAHLGNYVYAIGGIVQDKSHSILVERFNFNSKGWEYTAPLAFDRQFPKVCVSTNTNKIFIFGGCISNDHNSIVEVYDCHQNSWHLLGENSGSSPLVLKEPVNTSKSFVLMIEGNLNTLIQPLDKDDRPLFNDFDDKILIVTYDNLRFPAPSMYVINIEKETLGEVIYDKEGSDQASNAKRLLVYDEVGEHIVAFAQVNYREFDFMSLTNAPYRWRKSTFF